MSRALFPLSTGSHRHSGLTHQAPKHQEMHYMPFIPKITTLLLIQLSTGNLRATAKLAGEVFIDTIFDMRDHLLPLKPPGVYPGGGGAGHSARNNTGLMGEWGLAARARGRWRQEGTGASPRLPRRQDWYDGGEPGTSAGKLCAERTSHGITNLKDTWDFPCKGTRSPALSWVAGEGF